MGKSEVVPMPIHKQDNNFLAAWDFKMNIHTVEEDVEDDHNAGLPEDMEIFAHQVAGHNTDGKSYSIMKHNGTILKPITKLKCGETELQFYEEVNKSQDPILKELREFIPKYYGKATVPIRGRNIDCIVLEDLTKYYKEPCVMDIKIGRRTWDPNASYEKIKNEEMKYQDSRRDLAFCIPGFQVYKIASNQLCKFDKEYGKTLNKETVPQALRTFLNADSAPFCRSLLVQFLAILWRIQMWLRKQRRYHFFSSSILLVYDARRLREFHKTDDASVEMNRPKLQRSTSLYRPLSLAVLNNDELYKIPTGFSGQLTNQGPILKPQRSPTKLKQFAELISSGNVNNHRNRLNDGWHKSIRSLKRTHSFQNNYDKDIQSKKQDYTYILDELCMEQKSELWATVKMIDFAHACPAEHHEVDKNYLEGIANLIKIFEEFLIESE